MSLEVQKDVMWTMKDGTKIQIKDMSESHAKNCLRLMIRRVRDYNSQIKERQSIDDFNAVNNERMEDWMDDDWMDDDWGDRG